MRLLFGFGIPILCLWNMIITARYCFDKHLLTARRFAIIISSGLSITTFFYFFFFLAFEEINMPIEWIILGLGITFLHFIVSYPVGWLFYKFFVKSSE